MKLFLVLFCIFFSLTLFSQDDAEYIIRGSVIGKGIDNTHAYLSKASYQKDETYYIDSALIRNNSFVFKGKVDQDPALYHITISTNHCWVVIEQGFIDFHYIEDSPTKYIWTIEGTPINNELYKWIIIPTQEIAEQADTLRQMQEKGLFTLENAKDISFRMTSLSRNFYVNYSSFIKKNINNPVGEYFLLTLGYLNDKDIAEIEPKLSLPTKEKFALRTLEIKKTMRQINDSLSLQIQPESTREGKQYADFEAKKTDGSLVRLSELMKEKKLILIDFWASWCTPCLREMPSIRELWMTYKDRGLEIIGISLDEDERLWKKSIEKHNMSWSQLLNLHDEINNVKKIYGIDAIPHIILIDQQGKIQSRGLRGQYLDALIETLMKEH